MTQPHQPRNTDAVLGGGSPSSGQLEANLRIEGANSADIDAVVRALSQSLEVLEESRDYKNRRNPGLRRYLRVSLPANS